MRPSWLHQHARLLPLLSIALSGCGARGAPSFTLVGAYFPAWMLFALVGILAAIGARAGSVDSDLAGTLPFQLLVCVSIGVCIALCAWLLWFGA